MTNICEVCGAKIPNLVVYCSNCGAPTGFHLARCRCVIIDDPLDNPKILKRVKKAQEEDERGFSFSKEDQETYK